MKTRLLVLGALAAASLGACSSAPTTTAGGVPVGPAGAKDDVDACSLLTDAEIEPVLGKFQKHPGGLTCSWENTDDYHSVTINLGGAGTAPGDVLPDQPMYGETEPGPDGMRYAPGNVVLFACDGRANDIQVVTNPFDDSDRPKATEFAKLVRERLG